ncbi:MAG: ABC transporter ATP-binding protein/permease [Lachnospiraceae bacterium]|nr:ABC transporter ATP-binding protein/permease [Lachnospiraceae bacterium]
MMINKRLIGTVSKSKEYIGINVLLQWCGLVANIVIMAAIAGLLGSLPGQGAGRGELLVESLMKTIIIVAIAVAVRFLCTILASRMGHLASREVKIILREKIYKKLLKLGSAYREKVQTSEVVQVASEGVDQLETYFGAYLPQFFYAMLAPLTLFVVLSFVSLPSALLLLVCVPMIPVTIVAVQRWAKKLLAKYWGQYTALGDSFLENLQGLTTLKIYQADEAKHKAMNQEAENFRRITMKVLTMQLNSITIMDLIAYGGTALGVILAVTQYSNERISLAGSLFIMLLSADFFIPMRQLGSFFHIAMNGMAASDKIFRLLDLPEEETGRQTFPEKASICCSNLDFSYDGKRQILQGVNLEFPSGSLTSIVGESGCGKSTLASLLMGRHRGFTGSVCVGGSQEVLQISEEELRKNITYVGHQSYLFKGTVRDNLLMGKQVSDEELWKVLERVKLADFLRQEEGLDTRLLERASNLSGGQRQRLALARALLYNSQIYIFDEAASNIDVESENDIMEEVYHLAKEKTVILISHRLANVTVSDRIYVIEGGRVKESGNHQELLAQAGVYAALWNTQQSLENYGKRGGQG